MGVLVLLAGRAVALPTNSPVCNVLTAQTALSSSGMTPLTQLPLTTYTLTASSTTYTPGMTITFTLSGASTYRGILLYTSTAASETVQVGTWTIPTNMQNNAKVCTNSDNANSSVTHTQITGNYTTTSFTYTAPATNVGDLHVNMILVQVGSAGYAYQITPCAAIIKAATVAATTPASTVKTSTPAAAAATPATTSCSTVVQTTTMTSTTMVRVTTTVTTIRTITVTPAASASKCIATVTPNAMTTTTKPAAAVAVTVTQCCLGDSTTTARISAAATTTTAAVPTY
ncbi:hypothetical protein HDU82_000713 [Entophlyctis luteolus]|nr:hypothetical protein HDU82_000713 [Entophlyctis luteolus]